jgi:hypothetical protein
MRNVNGDDKWILKLPPNAPVRELIAPPNVEPALAKKLLCLEACKQLHQIGALDEHLQPVSVRALDEHIQPVSVTALDEHLQPVSQGTETNHHGGMLFTLKHKYNLEFLRRITGKFSIYLCLLKV